MLRESLPLLVAVVARVVERRDEREHDPRMPQPEQDSPLPLLHILDVVQVEEDAEGRGGELGVLLLHSLDEVLDPLVLVVPVRIADEQVVVVRSVLK